MAKQNKKNKGSDAEANDPIKNSVENKLPVQRKFVLVGIQPPGRIHLYKVGEVNLMDLSDDELQKIYDNGCPFLKPAITNQKMPSK